MNKLTFITGNKAKAEQLGRHLQHPVEHLKLDLPEIQSLDLNEVVTEKVKSAYEQINSPVLVEDTALIFQALGKLPGTFIKFFLSELGNDGLTKILNGYSDRSATAKVCFGYYDGKEIKYFDA